MTVDCLTFRRHKLSAPQAVSTAQSQHQQSCTACRAFSRQIDTLEGDLYDVLTLPVPDGLAEQIILGLRKPQRIDRSYLAMAATIVLAVIASITFYISPDPNGEGNYVAEALAAHVASEPEVLRERGSIAPARLVAALSEYGGILEEPVSVTYVISTAA